MALMFLECLLLLMFFIRIYEIGVFTITSVTENLEPECADIGWRLKLTSRPTTNLQYPCMRRIGKKTRMKFIIGGRMGWAQSRVGPNGSELSQSRE